MIFGGQSRSPKALALIVAAFVFVAAFVSLVYNHLDAWDMPSNSKTTEALIPPTDTDQSILPVEVSHESLDDVPALPPSTHSAEVDDAVRKFFLEHIHKPSIAVDAKTYKPHGAFSWDLPDLPEEAQAMWTKPMGENLCIIDLDNRPFDEPNMIFGPDTMTWDNKDQIHGLSLGVLNHWIYAKIHGYKYYYVAIDTFEDRRASWKKPTIMSKILKDHDACLYLDSDAIFNHLDLPFEWLMNYWQIHPNTNSLALALDPDAKNNEDQFGKTYLNTGFIIAQKNDKTFKIMKEWEDCPNEGGTHPDCVDFRTNVAGKPTDQGGFGTYIRYDYAEDIKNLPCTEANGFPESHSGCDGTFIRHLWTGKSDWIKVNMGLQIPGDYLELFHKQYIAERDSFYITEEKLLSS